jgi:hypothetical protein
VNRRRAIGRDLDALDKELADAGVPEDEEPTGVHNVVVHANGGAQQSVELEVKGTKIAFRGYPAWVVGLVVGGAGVMLVGGFVAGKVLGWW